MPIRYNHLDKESRAQILRENERLAEVEYVTVSVLARTEELRERELTSAASDVPADQLNFLRVNRQRLAYLETHIGEIRRELEELGVKSNNSNDGGEPRPNPVGLNPVGE